jgi:hypothetical protein
MRELADLLISRGVLTPQEVDDALQSQAIYGDTFDTNLLELGLVREEQLQPLLELAHRLKNRVDVTSRAEPDALKLLKSAQAQKYRIVPFRVASRVLDIVTNDPRDVRSIDEVAFLTGCRVMVNVATEARVAWHMFRSYEVVMPERLHATFAVQSRRKPPTFPPAIGAPPPVAAPLVFAPAAPRSHEGVDIGWKGEPVITPTHTGPAPEPPSPLPPRPPAPRAKVDDLLPPIALPSLPPPPVAEKIVEPVVEKVVEAEPAPPIAPVAPEPASSYEGTVWTGLESLTKLFDDLASRDEIPGLLLGYLAPRMSRVALFTVNKGRALGWDARGGKLRKELVETIAIALDRPSVFARVADSGEPFLGELPLDDVEETFVVKLGSVFPDAGTLLWPIRVRGRTVALIYGEPLAVGETAVSEVVKQIVDLTEAAFVRLILEKKR